MSNPEAFLLLTLPDATLTFSGVSQTGLLNLECVTLQIPNTSDPLHRDVYLVLRLGAIEIPLDPALSIQTVYSINRRTYTIYDPIGTSDTSKTIISVAIPASDTKSSILQDIETFETVLAQYSTDFHGHTNNKALTSLPSGFDDRYEDLRGHLIVVNEDNGEVLAQVDPLTFSLKEDPQLHQHGHENDAVLIEVPDNRPGHEQDATALEMFARAVPPDQQDWITKSATVVSHAISTTTNLLLTAITTASDYYITHSKPSPHHPSSTSRATTPTPPPRALVFLTSERTRKGLSSVHTVSSQAVQVSSKTVSKIDSMIRRAMGNKPKRERQFNTNSTASNTLSPNPTFSTSGPPPLPPRTPSPLLSPPPYSAPGQSNQKPLLPPRRSPSPSPPLPPRPSSTNAGQINIVAPQPRAPLSKKERILLSADLILSTIDHDSRRLLDAGSSSIGSVVGHKYGPEAAESSQLLTGTARNVGLVYVDMRGIGRRALLKSAGSTFRVFLSKSKLRPMVNTRFSSYIKPGLLDNLPIDLKREILEMAAFLNHSFALRLAVVSREIQPWAERIIYRELYFSGQRYFHRGDSPDKPTPLQQFKVVLDARPPAFFAEYVRSLHFDGSADLDDIIPVIQACTGVTNFGMYASFDGPKALEVARLVHSLPLDTLFISNRNLATLLLFNVSSETTTDDPELQQEDPTDPDLLPVPANNEPINFQELSTIPIPDASQQLLTTSSLLNIKRLALVDGFEFPAKRFPALTHIGVVPDFDDKVIPFVHKSLLNARIESIVIMLNYIHTPRQTKTLRKLRDITDPRLVQFTLPISPSRYIEDDLWDLADTYPDEDQPPIYLDEIPGPRILTFQEMMELTQGVTIPPDNVQEDLLQPIFG
ncbi:hypothetical protein H0H93_013632 [Arthromyces matolae]|nr:hypothetical protein H0H93_013632 [Arthromyces matolae]